MKRWLLWMLSMNPTLSFEYLISHKKLLLLLGVLFSASASDHFRINKEDCQVTKNFMCILCAIF